MTTKRYSAVLLAIAIAGCLQAFADAQQQSPHGGTNVKPQPGPNVNAAAGVVDPTDPAAFVKSDLLMQRQNEFTGGASSRNPDHLLFMGNDYRFVDFPQDQFFGGQMGFFARLIAKLFGRPTTRQSMRAQAISVGAWTGVYRSCDGGATWTGGALPGGPLDFSEASVASPLKTMSNLAQSRGGHAETTDPVMAAGTGGRMHAAVLGFERFPATGNVGESKIFYASYTDRNDREGGTCFNYDFTRVVDTWSAHQKPGQPPPFLDKPAIAVDKDGTIYISYTVFIGEDSKIVVARSTDSGVTWSKTQPLLSIGMLKNHGSTLAVDQKNGTVYLAWRLFFEEWPLMVISKSYDKGKNFLPATPISHFWPAKSLKDIVKQLKAAKLRPFDQFTGEPPGPAQARSLAFPHLVAGVVGGNSKLFAVWAERAQVTPGQPKFGEPYSDGSPRIMLSMSTDGGWQWTPRKAFDAGPRNEHELQQGVGPIVTRPSGPQIQPQLSISGTANPQLLALFYEAREELAQPYGINFISGIDRLFEVRVARINPVSGLLVAPSAQVSEYPLKPNASPAALAETAPGYRKGNYGNETMYSGGLRAFIGDYPVIVPTLVFEKGPNWKWATEPSPSVTMFTDNRDAEFPKVNGQPDIDGDWTTYQAVNKVPPTCDHVALRNANPYFSAIGGVFAGSPQTFKPLNIQRSFVVYVKNRTTRDRFFRLTIQDNEAAGVDGSFDQFEFGETHESIDVMTFANSSQTRTLWVNPAPNPTASVKVLVQEISRIGAPAPVSGGYSARVILNPDDNNNPIISVPPAVPGSEDATFDQNELHNPQLGSPQQGSPQISTFHVKTPQQGSPQISTPQQGSVGVPQISTSNETTPQLGSPQLGSPQLGSIPDGEQNGTDVTFTVTNLGNTNSQYEALFHVDNVLNLLDQGRYQFQVLITRTSFAPGYTKPANGPCGPAAVTKTEVVANIPVPQLGSPQISTINNPQLGSPQQGSPQISTFSVGPENGPEGQNSHGDEGNEDAHSTVLQDVVYLTVRAIRLRELGPGEPVFNPNAVEAQVTAASTNVIDGVVQEDGTQPEASTEPDLVVANYTPASPELSTPVGGQVTLSSWSMRNQGSGPIILIEGEIGFGYYLSTDAVITAEDILLGSGGTGGIGAGQQINFDAPTLTIPAGVAPGQYFIGILVDRTNFIEESNEGNNFVSEPIDLLVAAPPQFVVTNINDSGPGSLREAILASNEFEGTDTITFDLDGPGVITPQTPLPGLNDAVVVDATPGGGGACVAGTPPSVRIHGSSAGISHGLQISAGGTTIRGLSITGFQGAGIFIAGGGESVIECNYLGLAPDGTIAGNGTGLRIAGANINLVGGTTPAARNVISGNSGNGVEIQQASANQVAGNYIGTNPSGTAAVPNLANGVHLIDAPANTVGGDTAAARNVISGNAGEGVRLDGAGTVKNTISHNYVGTSASGTADVGNGASGIYIRKASFNFVLNNVASGNNGFAGIAICGSPNGPPVQCGGGIIGDQESNASGNTLQANVIGVGADGLTPVPNAGYGVSIDGASGTFVGGTTAATRNVITNNGLAGVVLFNPPLVENLIRGNSISANGGLGIDLIGDGVTANDGGDADDGPNNLQNFPVLTSAAAEGNNVSIEGSFNSASNQTFTLDFYVSPSCDSSGNGEGAVYIGSSSVDTNADGNADFGESFDFPVSAGNQFTATATDSDGNTSEFSNCVGAEFAPPILVNLAEAFPGSGTLLPGQSYNETRAAQIRPFNDLTIVEMTLAGLNVPAGAELAVVGARIWDSEGVLIASADTKVPPGLLQTVTIPIEANLNADNFYRVGFVVLSVPGGLASATLWDPGLPGTPGFPYGETTEHVVIEGGFATTEGGFPTTANTTVPLITLRVLP